MTEENVRPADSNTGEELTDLYTVNEESDSTETETESLDELKARLAKAEELSNNYKIRAEKAEKIAKKKDEVETRVETKPDSSLSSRELFSLVKAGVAEEDLDEVVEYARFKKISITEALKSPVVKATLAERSETRSTAQATNTGRTRSGSVKQTGESLLDKAQKTGELPERDEDLQALVAARYKR